MKWKAIDGTSTWTWVNFNQDVQIEDVNSIKFICLFVNAESLSPPENWSVKMAYKNWLKR